MRNPKGPKFMLYLDAEIGMLTDKCIGCPLCEQNGNNRQQYRCILSGFIIDPNERDARCPGYIFELDENGDVTNGNDRADLR